MKPPPMYPNDIQVNEDKNNGDDNNMNNVAKEITKVIDESGRCINNGNINMNHLDFFTDIKSMSWWLCLLFTKF